MLLSSSGVTIGTLNRRLVVALVLSAALALGLLTARAVSGPEKREVPVIQLDRGQVPGAPAPTPDTTAQPVEPTAVEPTPPSVEPAPPPLVPAAPEPSAPGTLGGDGDGDDAPGGGDDDDGGGDDDGDD